MKITYNDFEQYTKNAPQYSDGLIFVQSGTHKKDVLCLVMWLRRLCQATEGLSFMLITSSFDSKDGNLRKTLLHSRKVGRPKMTVKGTLLDNHIHGLLVSQNSDIDIKSLSDDLKRYCNKRRKKRTNLRQQKVKKLDGMHIVSYMDRQSISEYKYGSFDFDYFKDVRYCKYPEEDNLDNI